MWTDRHRTRHEARLKDMVLQAGLDEVACFLERADPPRSLNARPVRLVLAAITWHLRVGGAWRALPAGFPNWRTVYGWFRRWIEKGLFESLMRAGRLACVACLMAVTALDNPAYHYFGRLRERSGCSRLRSRGMSVPPKALCALEQRLGHSKLSELEQIDIRAGLQ